jgi:integrase
VLATWKKGLVAEGYSASTIHSILGVVSMVFDRAVADHYIERNPMRMPGSLKRWPELRVAKTLTRPASLTFAQATKLLEILVDPYRMLVLLLLYTGLRFGAATALEWRHLERRAYFDFRRCCPRQRAAAHQAAGPRP